MARSSACNRRQKTVRFAAASAGLCTAVVAAGAFIFCGTSEAASSSASVTFSGSAAADGMRVTTKASGVPLTDTPVDGGGPTAQVVADSVGTSRGYAALPDPGTLVITGPGLVAGALGGAAPVTPPQYPLYVASDSASKPDASFTSTGAQLSARSETEASSASAEAGVQASGPASVAYVHSLATIGSAGATVVAKAVSSAEGFAVGPLRIGLVTSSASETLDATGRVTGSTRLDITGMRIGGVSVGLNPDGLTAGSGTQPVPVNATLAKLLKGSGITMEVVGAQAYPDRVVAPALVLTLPSPSGTTRVTLGDATAQMSGSAASDDAVASTSDGLGSGDVPGIGGDSRPTSGTPGTAPSPPAVGAEGPPVGVEGGFASHAARNAASGQPTLMASTDPLGLDLRSLYLVGVLTVIVACGGGQTLRRLGASRGR